MKIANLRTEYQREPLGIDRRNPRFSWELTAETWERDKFQHAYWIQAASDEHLFDAPDLWDTGFIEGSETCQIRYQGSPLHSRQRVFWRVCVRDERGVITDWSPTASFSVGLLDRKDWKASWIGIESDDGLPPFEPADKVWESIEKNGWGKGWGQAKYEGILGEETEEYLKIVNQELTCKPRFHNPSLSIRQMFREKKLARPRYVRREFTAAKEFSKAVLYATALGLYELYINGEKVGDRILSPEWTSYNRRVQYQTYDVTPMLRRGVNTLSARLGNGWYCGMWQFWPQMPHLYGREPLLLAQLEMETEEGRVLVVSNDNWKGTDQGGLRFSGLYEGEEFDARMEPRGFDQNGFDDSLWKNAVIRRPKHGKLIWQRSEPIRVTQVLRAVAVTSPKNKVYVFDFGQNLVGRIKIKVDAPEGTRIRLFHNEVLNADGTVYRENLSAGHMTRAPHQTLDYICAGGQEAYCPYFTYMGFRYVEVEGLPYEPLPDCMEAQVIHTDFAETGAFSCSDPLVSKLAMNIKWSQRGNMLGIPTDCPQRDERCGYTGDGQFFMPTGLYNMDLAAFNSKWIRDICQDSFRREGYFADHAPDFGAGRRNVGWQEAGVICPYLQYRCYGDTDILAENYEAMVQFTMGLHEKADERGLQGKDGAGNGDWLNLGGGASHEVIAAAYYIRVLDCMAEIARALDKDADADSLQALAVQARAAFADHLIDGEGRISDSSQTGYALAFALGLVPHGKREAAAYQFKKEMERFEGRLATGFIGTPLLLPALHAAGLDDMAYRVLLRRDAPSWLYPVRMGATTVWERWDGYTEEKGYADSGMNSFNHYAFGSVGEYLFSVIGGIKERSPGYGEFYIRPVIGRGLSWAKVSFHSIHGEIFVFWTDRGKVAEVEVGVPVNTRCYLTLPWGGGDDFVLRAVLVQESSSGQPMIRRDRI